MRHLGKLEGQMLLDMCNISWVSKVRSRQVLHLQHMQIKSLLEVRHMLHFAWAGRDQPEKRGW